MLGARGTHIIDSMAVRPHLRQDVMPIRGVDLHTDIRREVGGWEGGRMARSHVGVDCLYDVGKIYWVGRE